MGSIEKSVSASVALYPVFSDADYAWPPLPALFWGGKKVRLSDEGFLIFRWNGQDVPVYDLDHHHFDLHGYNARLGNSYTFTLPSESDMTKVNISRAMSFLVADTCSLIRQPLSSPHRGDN